MRSKRVVTPVKTGVQRSDNSLNALDSGFRRNDEKWCFSTFCERINIHFTLFSCSLRSLSNIGGAPPLTPVFPAGGIEDILQGEDIKHLIRPVSNSRIEVFQGLGLEEGPCVFRGIVEVRVQREEDLVH